MNSIKRFEYRIGKNFDKKSLSYRTKQLLDQNCRFLHCQEILLTISNLKFAYLEQLI